MVCGTEVCPHQGCLLQLCVAQDHSPEVGLIQARTLQIGSVEFRPGELRSSKVTMMCKRPLVGHVPAVHPGSGHAGDFVGADPIPRSRRHPRRDQAARQHNPGSPCHQHPTPPHTLSSHSATVTGPRSGVLPHDENPRRRTLPIGSRCRVHDTGIRCRYVVSVSSRCY